MTLRIANAAGFWGDQIDAAGRLLTATEVDVLTLEYLAELTMSILARQRNRDPSLGYATDMIDVLHSISPILVRQSGLKVVTNAGGLNPVDCARAAAKVLIEAGLPETTIAVITGDDLSSRLSEIQAAGCQLQHLDSNMPLANLNAEVVAANAYLGARPIVQALQSEARLVITGRVADASLTVGPAAWHYGWGWGQWDQLAGATVAGHLIECGAQVTGGYSTEWAQVPNLAEIGYPIAELQRDGSCLLTKPPESGGEINRRTVVEQLLYEVGDPKAYLTPDVVANVSTVQVSEESCGRVSIRGATGLAATDSYKVSLAYHDGYTASGQLLVAGNDCQSKAQVVAGMVWKRLESAGCLPQHKLVETFGAGENSNELVLRLAVRDTKRAKVLRFTREIAPLITSGPAGLAGYTSSRRSVQPVYSFWPTLVPKSLVKPTQQVRTASEWLEV